MRRSILAFAIVACSSPAAPPTPESAALAAPPLAVAVRAGAPAAVAPAPISAPSEALAAPIMPAPPAVARVRATGFDIRATYGVRQLYVLQRGPSREPASEGTTDEEGDVTIWQLGAGSGEPVRVVMRDSFCDGTLGARIRIQANYLDTESDYRAAIGGEVTGCEGPATLAIVNPTPGAPWPSVVPESDPAAAPAIAAARAAATALARGSSADSFEARAYRLEANVYAMAWGPRCDGEDDMGCTAAGTAVVVVEPGQPPRTLIVRPVHFPWEEPTSAGYVPCGILDVDGDASVELCESLGSDQGAMVRLIRPGEHRAGDVVWRMEERAEYTLPEAGPAPPPLATP